MDLSKLHAQFDKSVVIHSLAAALSTPCAMSTPAAVETASTFANAASSRACGFLDSLLSITAHTESHIHKPKIIIAPLYLVHTETLKPSNHRVDQSSTTSSWSFRDDHLICSGDLVNVWRYLIWGCDLSWGCDLIWRGLSWIRDHPS